ncbi:MAG TPA: beta-eliminating lyase-related protein, partial [Fimbriimonadaceae bacterium]|nr:beta-eliminating lyase-related protein [Fimbriimonadaceae bacterium]
AACGIVSLEKMVCRLAEDHERARRLGEACKNVPGMSPLPVPTNIVMVDTERPADEWQHKLEEVGVQCFSFAPHRLRFVTHRDVGDDEVSFAIEKISELGREFG